MEMCFVSKGINNFLEVNLGYIEDILANGNYYKIRMLEENNIPYVISPSYSEIDGCVKLSFCLNGGYVLERILMKRKPDGDMLRMIMNQVLECIEGLGEYLLMADDLVLTPEYIMLDSDEKKLSIIYIPGYGISAKEQLKNFLEHFMKVFDHNDKEGICILYDLYGLFCEERLDVGAVKKVLGFRQDHKQEVICYYDELQHEDEDISTFYPPKHENKIIEKREVRKLVGVCLGSVSLVAAIFCGLYYVFVSRTTICLIIGIGLLMLVAATGVLFLTDKKTVKQEAFDCMDARNNEEYFETSSVVEQQEILMPEKINRLVPLANGGLDIIHISMYEKDIVIGRGKKETDYRLPTTQISRVHASVHLRKEGVYVEDKGSTNGTYINSNRLNPFQEYPVSRGDVIAFANEEFFAS